MFNFRKFPHPQYGRYGGAYTRCDSSELYKKTGQCPVPISDLDYVFQKHDGDTGVANDARLVGRLVKTLPNVLNPNKSYGTGLGNDLYGRAYHVGALAVFVPIAVITTPIRSILKLTGRLK